MDNSQSTLSSHAINLLQKCLSVDESVSKSALEEFAEIISIPISKNYFKFNEENTKVSDAAVENVLGFAANLFEEHEYPQPSSQNVNKYLDKIFQQGNVSFMGRDVAETDESFKQIIPYGVLKYQDKYFVYARTKKGGEARLHSKLSLGVGGHINDDDVTLKTGENPYVTYCNGAERELKEEVGLDPYACNIVGVLYDDSTPVGRVHFGIVHLYFLLTDELNITEDAISPEGWFTLAELREQRDLFEPWSQIVIDSFLD